MLVAAVFFSIATTALIKPMTYEILRTQGLRAALAHISGSNTRPSPETLYREAWVHYRDNDFNEATRKISMVLDARISSSLRGNCFYLLGYLHISRGSFQEAFDFFHEAHAYYLTLNRPDLLFLSYQGMARAKTSLENYPEAEDWLDHAMEAYYQSGKQGSLGSLYSQRARISIGQARFAEALAYAQKSKLAFEDADDFDGLANALSDLGFLYQLNGDLNQGYAYTLRAQTLIVELGDPTRHYFNLINFILLDRCRGFVPNKTIVALIEDWANENQDEELLYFLDLALTETCHAAGDERRPCSSADLIEPPPSQ